MCLNAISDPGKQTDFVCCTKGSTDFERFEFDCRMDGEIMAPAPIKPEISPDVLDQLDIRVGTIKSVSDVPGADKLVMLRVDFGDHERTIVSGMKQERANPREIEGRQALFVVNLAPRKMKGVLSEGMVFDIGYADGVTPVLAIPEAPVPNGSRAG
jgi:tRNA-binding protein